MPGSKQLVRLALAVALGTAVASLHGSFTAPVAALVLVSLVGTAWGLAAPGRRASALLLVCAGVSGSALFLFDLTAWMRVTVALALAYLVVAAVPGWSQSEPRSRFRDLACGLGVAAVLPGVVAGSALALGRAGLLASALSAAWWPGLGLRLGLDALLVTTAVLACDGVRARPPHGAALTAALACVAAGLAVARVAWVTSMATLPLEVGWSEAPALVNALKLDAHLPLYGPPEALDSYTYSPLVDLAHHAVLAPVGLGVSLGAHRALAVLEQLGACALLAWALGPQLRRAGWGTLTGAAVLLTASLANMLAPAVHPDHVVLIAFAAAVALLVAEPRWPRQLWWAALFAVTPLAAAAKLTGAGIGVGLALAFALERRWRALLVVAASLAATAATVPLFDATLGAYRFYAIDVQRAHPMEWAKLWTLPTTAFGAAAAAAAASLAWMARRGPQPEATRVAILSGACAVASCPAWIKYAGRDNNLTLLAVGAACTWLLASTRRATPDAPRLHPSLPVAGALLALTAVAPPAQPLVGRPRAQALEEAAMVRGVIGADTATGRRTLVLLSAAEWIDAGRRDVPGDRYHSAVELFYAGLPQSALLFAHIEDGRYDTVVVNGRDLRGEPTPRGDFSARLRVAIESRYDLAGPPGAASPYTHAGALVYRRR